MIAGALVSGGLFGSGTFGASEVYAAEAAQQSQQNRITVTGKGEISVKPDIVYLSIGVESYAETAKSAQKHNAQKMEKIQALLKKTWKISDKDIKTEQFYVQPNYSYSDQEGRKVKNYNAYHSLEVTLRDLDKVGDLLDAASEAGANSIGNARFSIENREAYEAQVIEKAMENATLKAQSMARVAQRQLGAVVNMAESEAANLNIFNNYGAQNEAAMSKASTDMAATTVQSGEIKLVTYLFVQYELK